MRARVSVFLSNKHNTPFPRRPDGARERESWSLRLRAPMYDTRCGPRHLSLGSSLLSERETRSLSQACSQASTPWRSRSERRREKLRRRLSSIRTMPVLPSTVTCIPVLSEAITSIPLTAGLPYSRAHSAPCCSAPPIWRTTAEAPANIGVHAGSVTMATSTSPGAIGSVEQVQTRTRPLATPGEIAAPTRAPGSPSTRFGLRIRPRESMSMGQLFALLARA
mmetsp:Transcript_19462/g.64295  ORF Transcript_19462/g.64295 Transcript_19462/m.64295 type:complete len:222 (+) Transcript_19462:514-1179(+)